MLSFSDQSFTRQDGTLVAEASELGYRVGGGPMPREFSVRFRGGVRLDFTFSRRDTNASGGTTGWRYTRTSPHHAIHTVLIVND